MSGQRIYTRLTMSLMLVLAVGGSVRAQEEPASHSQTSSATTTSLADSPPPGQKQEPPQEGASVPTPSHRPVSERAFFKNVLSDQKTVWSAPLHAETYRVRFVLPFTLVTAGLIASDKAVARELSDSPPGTGFAVSRRISQVGTPAVDYAVASAFYGVGWLTENERARETGLLSFEALLNSTIVSVLLKTATQRQRPTRDKGRQRINDARGKFESGGRSFPSGHAMHAWALASVLAARYPDRPLIKYGVYGLAGLVSVARTTARKHFPSDTLVGGVLGYLIGHYVVRAHSPLRQQPGRITPLILPHADGKEYGVSVQIQF